MRKFVAVVVSYTLLLTSVPVPASAYASAGESPLSTLSTMLPLGYSPVAPFVPQVHLPAGNRSFGEASAPLAARSAMAISSHRGPAPAGVANPAPTPQSAPTNVSTISSNFNGTSIPAGRYVWFNSILKASGLGSGPTKLTIRGGVIQFTANGVPYTLSVPDSMITYSSAVTTASTTFDAVKNTWVTSAPISYSGNVFLAGLPYPVSSSLPGGINPVSWTATFYTDTPGVSVNWKWAAAVYTTFSTDHNALGVKPIDGSSSNPYPNSDHAGTPEAFKPYVTGGARGGGGSNWTGSYSGTDSVLPALLVNQPPIANAGPDQSVFVGANVQLDGTASSDPDGNPLTYTWSFVSVPSGSAAALSSTTSPTPSFFVDTPGSYTLQLVVNDGQVNSAPDQVVISTQNSAPVANAGPDQTVTTTSTVQLNGSGSTDVDGDPLTYRWTFLSRPIGSSATLSNSAIVNPTFVVDVPGNYSIQLIVNDGTTDSAADIILVSTVNSAPVANAGPDQSIVAGATVQLNGSASSDVDGDVLTYSWSILSKPEGSTAALSNPAVVNPTFVADRPGTFVVQLIVNDGTVDSAADTVTISTENTAPVANAGPDQTVTVGTLVTLDGSASSDADGHALTYQWSIVTQPAGSTATLSSTTIVNPTFAVDRPGDYVIQLIVNDGFTDSEPNTMIVSTVNSRPVASAGQDQTVTTGDTVQLNGSGSTDVDGDALTYSWSILTRPSGSTATLSDPHAANPTFVADSAGVFVIQLIVNDGTVDSEPDTVMITAESPNQAPVVNAGADQAIFLPANTATLTGTVTDDGKPTGAALSIQWTQFSGPGTVAFADSSQAITQATFPTQGVYQLRLTANDTEFATSSDVTITVIGNQAPVVSAGPDQAIGLPADTVTLQGSVTDDGRPVGSTVIVQWTQISGPGTVVFADPTQPVTLATFPVIGTYVLRLSATDSELSSFDDAQVILTPQNQPPMVSAGPDHNIAFPTNTVTLSGSASDDGLPYGSSLTMTWTAIVAPGAVTFSAPSALVTQAAFSVAGAYVLRLSVTDGQFISSSDVRVTVGTGNQIPVVNAGAEQVIVFPNSAGLQGSASDDGNPTGSTLTVQWSQVSGPGTATFADTSSASTSVSFSERGVYVLRLTASDGQLSASDDVRIFVGQVDCTRSNKGTDFWLAFSGNCTQCGTPTPPQDLILFISGDEATSGTVSVPGIGFSAPFSVIPGQVTQVSVPLTAQVTLSDLTENKGIHVTAQKPVSIYGLNFWATATDGFMALPTAALGTDYVNLTYRNTFGLQPKFPPTRGTGLTIVATQNGTTVTITPAAKVDSRQANVPYTVQLDQGQVYQLRNMVDFVASGPFAFDGPPVDLTGSFITSDKPIAAFGVHNCSYMPNGYGACNHLVEQLPPTNLWGRHFVSMPLFRETKGDTYRVVAKTDNTTVQLNGQVLAILQRGEFHEWVSIGAVELSADQAVLLAQYANASDFAQDPNLDPFMVLVPPFEQFGGRYTVSTPLTNFPSNHINVIAPTSVAQAGGVQLDGVALPSESFGPIGSTPFSGAQVSVSIGSHTLSSSLPFGITSYGWGSFDGYGYTGGVCLAQGVVNSSITATPATATLPLTSQSCITARITDASGAPLGGIGITFKVTGVNPITTVVTTDANGEAQFCFTGLNQGSDLVSISADDANTSASVTWVSNGPNQAPLVNAGADQTISLPLDFVDLNGSVIDDGLPVGGSLSFTWTQISGPGAATFNSPNQPITRVTFPAAGTYILQLAATDTDLASSDSVTIIVLPPNQAPAVDAGPDKSLTFVPTQRTISLVGSIIDDGLPLGNPVAINWSLFSGPDTVTFANAAAASTTATFETPGFYILRLLASDGQFTQVSFMVASVFAPVVNAGPDTSGTVSTPIALNGSVTVNGLSAVGTVSITWSRLSGPGTVTFSPNFQQPVVNATFSQAGTHVMRLNAAGAVLDEATVYVLPVAPPPAPSVSIAAPASGSEVTAPTDVTGSVSGGTWKLEYQREDDVTPQSFVTIASGSGTVTNATLGQFDPTLQRNGSYLIRLTSTDQFGQSAFAQVSVDVTRNMKVGVFSISFNDMTVPMAGIPLQIIRTYDSRDRGTQGDFGYGWSLGLSGNARVKVKRNLGLNWTQTANFAGLLPQYCIQPLDQRVVTVTFPEGRVYRFELVPPSCQLAVPIQGGNVTFQQLPGATAGTSRAKLDALDPSVLYNGSIPGSGNVLGFDGNAYDPQTFRMTTAEGFAYVVDKTKGLLSVTDPNGNKLTFTANGVIHSAGKSLLFIRDTEGRITRITDPAGNAVNYEYDYNGDLSRVLDREALSTTFQYGNTFPGAGLLPPTSNHLLTQIIDPRNVVVATNTYDTAGRLTLTEDAFSRNTTFTHNIPARTETITNRLLPTPGITTYVYDNNGNVLQVTDALGHVTSSTYDADDNVLTETNALGKTTTYTYDAFGNRLTEQDPLGHTTTYTYNARNQVLTVKDALNRTTTNTYDANGNLASTTDPLGRTTQYIYFTSGLLRRSFDALNQITDYNYDASGNLISTADALGNVSGDAYDATNFRNKQTATRTVPLPGGGTATQTLETHFHPDRSGRTVRTVNSDGTETRVIYNSNGQQEEAIDELNRSTTFVYDNAGRLTQTNFPDGTNERSTYDNEGRRISSNDRAGRLTSYAYDFVGRLTRTTFSDATFTETTYDAAGQVLTTKDQRGNITTYAYDDAGRRTSVTDALTQVTTFVYDDAGQLLSTTDARGNTTTNTYDAAGRLIKVTHPDTTFEETTYDELGRVTARKDAAGKVTQYGYDAIGRLVSVTDALNQVTTYAYDEVGSRTAQTDALNRTTTFEYDMRGRRTKRTLPLGQVESYTYNAAGNLTGRTDFNGKVTTYTYDAVNRLKTKVPDASFAAPTVTFNYNNDGQRSSMIDSSGTTSYLYNSAGRLVTRNTPQGSIGYQYDAAGNVTRITAGVLLVNYTYDVLNRLKTVQEANTGTSTYNYDPNGNLANVAAPNGVQHAYTYNTKNQLTNLGVTNAAAAPLRTYAYTLAPSGHRLSVTELSGRTATYTYDNIYRLTSETIAGDTAATPQNGAINYTYDAVGNRQTRGSTVPAIPAIPAGVLFYDANDRTTGGADIYDANGNTIGSAGFAVTYDFENRLIKRQDPTVANDDIIVIYNGDGERVEKRVQTGPTTFLTTRYLVDNLNPTGYSQVIVETTTNNNFVRQYVYGLDLISQRRQLTSTTFEVRHFGYDGHGSTRFLTDNAAAVTDTFDYDAFGNLISRTGTTPTHYLYAGEQFDADLNLYYNRARYLDVRTGRFWTMDTFEGDSQSPLSVHKYLYALSDPINASDPSGRFTLSELGTSQGIINVINTATNIVSTAMRAYNFASSALQFADFVPFILEMAQAAAQPSPALATTALVKVVEQKFGQIGIKSLTAGLRDAFDTLGPSWTEISKAIKDKAAVIAAEAAPQVARRIPTYLALQAQGRLKVIFFAPSAPIGREGDRFVDVGSRAQVALSLGGGRLFGLGIRTSGSNYDQVFRIDYWDTRLPPSRPTRTPLHVHYHIYSDGHPPNRTIWP